MFGGPAYPAGGVPGGRMTRHHGDNVFRVILARGMSVGGVTLASNSPLDRYDPLVLSPDLTHSPIAATSSGVRAP